MKTIALTKGMVAKVDDADFEELSKFKWYATPGKRTWYAVRHKKNDKGIRSSFKMHTQLMDTPKGMMVDHIDGDGLNNQRNNLRVVTQTQNMRNTYKHRDGHLPGVTISRIKQGHRTYTYYVAWKTIKRKNIYLGVFKTPEGAHEAFMSFENGTHPKSPKATLKDKIFEV